MQRGLSYLYLLVLGRSTRRPAECNVSSLLVNQPWKNGRDRKTQAAVVCGRAAVCVSQRPSQNWGPGTGQHERAFQQIWGPKGNIPRKGLWAECLCPPPPAKFICQSPYSQGDSGRTWEEIRSYTWSPLLGLVFFFIF